MKRIYDCNQQFVNNEYGMMIHALIGYTPYFSLVVRKTIALSSRGEEALRNLKSFLVFEGDVTEWPGTSLHHGTARLYIYRLSQESASLLLKYSGNIFDWMQPDLPEDLCFLRGDKSGLIVSISHEKDCYLELTDAELDIVKKKLTSTSGDSIFN